MMRKKQDARLLPVFAAIDRGLKEKGRLLVAIEGGAGAGKSTLAELLGQIYDCNLFHMDDFFLQAHQRTPERYAQPGGNVDYERFLKEVLDPLERGEVVQYCSFDCGSMKMQSPVEIPFKPLNIIEGAYSLHPVLSQKYDLKIFLKISPAIQEERIRKRNTFEYQELFFTKWIPLEHAYFEAFQVEEQCGIVLEGNA